MDKFNTSSSLLINGKRGFKTYFGLLNTFVFLCIFIIVSVTFTVDFLSDNNLKTTVYNIELNNNYTDFYFEYMVAFPEEYKEQVRLLEYDTYYYTINNKECKDEQFKKFSNVTIDETLFYLCNELTQPNRAYDLYYRLVDCHTLNINPEFWMARDETCKKNLTNNSNFFPQLWARYPYFNESRPEEGLKYNLINLKSKIYDFDYFTVNLQSLKLDQDYFTKIYKKYFFITPETYSKGEDRRNLFNFEFEVNNYLEKVVDKPKIPELLLKISGIMGIIQIILSYLSNYYCKFAFKKFIFNESFDEQDCLEVNQLYSAKYPSMVDAIYKKGNGIKNLTKILCFRNFLSKSLGIPFKEESIYNFIENVLNRKISLENIISRTLTMNMEGEKNNLQMNLFYKTSLHREFLFLKELIFFPKVNLFCSIKKKKFQLFMERA
jgi:hypothetical protein